MKKLATTLDLEETRIEFSRKILNSSYCGEHGHRSEQHHKKSHMNGVGRPPTLEERTRISTQGGSAARQHGQQPFGPERAGYDSRDPTSYLRRPVSDT